MLVEKDAKGFSGWMMLILLAAVAISSVTLMVAAIQAEQTAMLLLWIPVLCVAILCFFGLTVVNPNQSNPIEIAAVVVWKVVDTAEAVFQVDDYEHFVHVQSEAALRNLATRYPYDSHREGDMSLRMSVLDIAHQLRDEIQERLAKAGVEVIEARITHLAYASEIASAMLRRQQAKAIIAARQMIVEGAVGMVEMALEQLSAKHVVELDEERKASMVSNLLVVLCSDRDAQPIVNAGTLYQ